MKNKKFFILIIIILIAGGILYYYLESLKQQPTEQIQKQPIEQSMDNNEKLNESQCINRYNNYYKYLDLTSGEQFSKNFQSGEIDVGFKKNMSEQEIKNFIELKGLEMKSYISKINNARIIVPEGKELEWVCKLTDNRGPKTVKEDEIIRYAEFVPLPAPPPLP